MPLSVFSWLLAISPVVVILILMLGFRWSGSRAGVAGWLVAQLVASLSFGAGPRLLAYAQVKGMLLSLDVIYLIWAALLLYHMANEAGAVGLIGQTLQSLTSDRVMQGLLLGWVFASFLQGLGGFGVPVAVTAPLLVAIGFSPVQAVLMACIGHGWAVNYGSMATSYQTLLAVTGLPGEYLAADAAILLGFSCFACGFLVAWISGGRKAAFRTLPAVLIIGAVMAVSQFFLATNGMWTLGATGAALVGLLAGLVVTRIPAFGGEPATDSLPGRRTILLAFSAYGLMVIMAVLFNLVPPINAFVDQWQITLQFPELQTSLGWVTPAESGRQIILLGHPGAILSLVSVISFFTYKAAGFYKPGAPVRILSNVVRSAVNSSLGIIAMVGMSITMSNSGMTNLLAEGMSRLFGPGLYPLAASFIGALGAFITGSNNTSNVLFGVLQMRTAELLGLSVSLILGAQTTGGSLGSVLSATKVMVGCSTVGLGDNESVVMKPVLLYGIFPIILVAILAMVMSWLGMGA